ncbi:MAG: BREX system ATP-binding domain-containing protein [Pleomorphochaeta sp.]
MEIERNYENNNFSFIQNKHNMNSGVGFINDFWEKHYLKEYIKEGGSKIKFITGSKGSGKSYLMNQFNEVAKNNGYLTVSFSANEIWLNDFKFIFLETLRQCDLDSLMEKCAKKIITELGYDYNQINDGENFIDYLASLGKNDAIERGEIRNQLRVLFKDNPKMDINFALACSLLCGGVLGQPPLEDSSKELIFNWLYNVKGFRITSLRPLGMSPARITKFNARTMLQSLSELVIVSGYAGLIVTIDDLEILVDRSSLAPLHYTKMRREDTYESIRELIDDIDNFKHIMFIFGCSNQLIDNEKMGMKSYQALWMRIQNEVWNDKINNFGDIINMDDVARQVYTPEVLVNMSKEFSSQIINKEIEPKIIDEEYAKKLIEKSKLGGVSIPILVKNATLGITNMEEN